MSRLRRLRWFAGPWMLSVALAGSFAGCGPNGVGIDQCRTIEEARCNAATHCDDGLSSASKVLQCSRFSRDNCLHGLPVEAPHDGVLNRCVDAIKAAGTCARRDGGGILAKNCDGLVGSFASDNRTTVCDVIDAPEVSSECGFLTTTPVEEKPKDAGSD